MLARGLAPALAQGTISGNMRITMRPNPPTVPADGKSRSRIRIEVRDRAERPAPDGTPVLCHVDNGLLGTCDADKAESLSVTTSGGYATVYCSSKTPGSATVMARVQDSRTEVVVVFLPKGEAARAYSRVVDIRGGCVGYCLELGVIQARDGARARVGKLVFDAADGLEVRLGDNTIRGWGVRITRKGERLAGENFFYDLARQRGMLRRFGDDGVERGYFSAYGLKDAAERWEVPEGAFRGDDREGDTWLVCKSCQYFLGQKVVVKHATLYAGPQKVFSFPPYWVIGLPGYSGASNTQVIGASTDGGLAVNFPFFYRVTDEWAGSVKVQRGASGSSFVARDGWSFAIAEEYDTGDAKGSVEASGLLKSDWGIEWRDEREVFGDNQGFFNVSWPDHHSVFADASLYHYGDSYRFNLRGQYDNPQLGGESYHAYADWLTDPRDLSSDASYRLGLSLGVRRYDLQDEGWIFENELYGALDFDSWRIGNSVRVTPSITNVYSWDTGEYSSNSAKGQLRMAKRLGSRGRLGLNYYLGYRSGDTSRPGINQSLGLDFSLSHGAKWSGFLNGTWDMTVGDTYGYLAFDYYVKPKWRVGLMATHYDFSQTKYEDLEFAVARSLGSREVGLRYSVDSGRLSLEFGGLGFSP